MESIFRISMGEAYGILDNQIIVEHLQFKDKGTVTILSCNLHGACVGEMSIIFRRHLKAMIRINGPPADCIIVENCRAIHYLDTGIEVGTEHRSVAGDIKGGRHRIGTRFWICMICRSGIHRRGVVTKVPHHTIARIVHQCAEVDRLIRTELRIGWKIGCKNAIDEQLFLERHRSRTRCITIRLVETQTIAVGDETTFTLQSMRAVSNMFPHISIIRAAVQQGELSTDSHTVQHYLCDRGSGNDNIDIVVGDAR